MNMAAKAPHRPYDRLFRNFSARMRQRNGKCSPPSLQKRVTFLAYESGKTFPFSWAGFMVFAGLGREASIDADNQQFGIRIADKVKRIGTLVISVLVNMAQDIQISSAPNYSLQFRNAKAVWGGLLIAALMATIYAGILMKLVTDWWQIPDFSHGFLVPVFSAYLVWTKRKALNEIAASPSWGGVVVVAGGLLALFLGVYGAEMFLSRISLVILLAGLVLTFGGTQFLKELRFPLLVLPLAIPIPAILFSQITFPLQLLASKLASNLLPLVGVPILRDGNVIQLSSMSLEVAEACSGIRSLMSLFTLSVFFGYFVEKSVLNRTVLALASVPIAIAANAVRIFGTGMCVQYWNPDKAQGFFHEFSGWVMFLVSLACLFVVHVALHWPPPSWRRR